MSTAVLTQITEPVTISTAELIEKLKGLAYQRKVAIKMHPGAPRANVRLEVIEDILCTLDTAEGCLNPTQAVKLCLRVAPSLLFIAPDATPKLYTSYYNKIEQLMNGCREYLGWSKQQ